MDVTEFLKKSLAFGYGAVSFSTEKMKQFVDDMVAHGEMSSEDATRFIDDVSTRSREDKNSIQEWVSEQVSKMVRQAGAAEAEHVERLEARVDALELRVADLCASFVSEACDEIGVSEEAD